MDFIDPEKKKAHRIRLYIGYFLMSIALTLGTLLLVFLSFGYNLDTNSGVVIQDGLIFLDSQPQDATIYINGKVEKSKTGTRLGLPEGKYKIELQKEKYRSWEKTFLLEGGSLERIEYPFLFPTNLISKERQNYTSRPGLITSSLDRHWLMVQEPGSMTVFDIMDANEPKKPTSVISLQPNLLTPTKKPQNWEAVEWSSDNRHVLLRHNFDSSSEYILVDIQEPTKSINLSKLFKINSEEITLIDRKFDKYFIYDNASGKLQKTSLDTPTLGTYLENVLAYKSHGDNLVLFATPVGATEGKVMIKIQDNEKLYNLRELPLSPKYLLDLAKYDGSFFMIAGSQSDNRAYVYKDPLNTLKQQNPRYLLPAFVLAINNPQFVSFSNNAQFIAIQNGPNFVIYDAHNDRQYKYAIDMPIVQSEKAIWMNGHRLTTVSQGKSVIWDYDGTNKQVLTNAVDGTRLMFDRDYTILYNLDVSASAPGQFNITKTPTRVLSPEQEANL